MVGHLPSARTGLANPQATHPNHQLMVTGKRDCGQQLWTCPDRASCYSRSGTFEADETDMFLFLLPKGH